jgi:hypothetical protein
MKNQTKIKRNTNRKIKRKIKNPLVPVGGQNRYKRLKEQNKSKQNSENTFGTGCCCEPVLKVTFRTDCWYQPVPKALQAIFFHGGHTDTHART